MDFANSTNHLLDTAAFSLPQVFSSVCIGLHQPTGGEPLSSSGSLNFQTYGSGSVQVFAGTQLSLSTTSYDNTSKVLWHVLSGSTTRIGYGRFQGSGNAGTNGIPSGLRLGGRSDNASLFTGSHCFVGLYPGDVTRTRAWPAFIAWAGAFYRAIGPRV